MEQDEYGLMPTAAILFLIIFLVGMIGCAGDPPRQYNREEEQDRKCLNGVGGQPGYCGMFTYPRGK